MEHTELTIEFLDEFVRTGKRRAGDIAALAESLRHARAFKEGKKTDKLITVLQEDVPFVLQAQKMVEKTEGKIAAAEKWNRVTRHELNQAKEQLYESSQITNDALEEVYKELKKLEKRIEE